MKWFPNPLHVLTRCLRLVICCFVEMDPHKKIPLERMIGNEHSRKTSKPHFHYSTFVRLGHIETSFKKIMVGE